MRKALRIWITRRCERRPCAADVLGQWGNVLTASAKFLHQWIEDVSEDEWHFDRMRRPQLSAQNRRLPREFVHKSRRFSLRGSAFCNLRGVRHRWISTGHQKIETRWILVGIVVAEGAQNAGRIAPE